MPLALQELLAAGDVAQLHDHPRQFAGSDGGRPLGQAGFQVFAGLAPQLVAHAQPSQRQQQHRVLRPFPQPAFGVMQRPTGIARAQMTVEFDQPLIPLPVEGDVQHLLGQVITTDGAQLAGIGQPDLGMPLERQV